MFTVRAVIRCPVCGVDIPADIAETPDTNGLTVAYDTTLVDEHTHMHSRCTCRWNPHRLNQGCPVHG